MGTFKKLLFISGLCLANFYAFAETESEPSAMDCSENNYSEDTGTEETASWLTDYPTYAQLRVGLGMGSKLTYFKNGIGGKEDDFKKGVFHQQIGLEIGKIVDEWRFGIELGYFHGSVKKQEINQDVKDKVWYSMHGLMLLGNVYYHIPLTEEKEWALVLGAGLGVDCIKFHLKGWKNKNLKDGTCFAAVCQGYVGLAYDINNNATINVGYRLHKLLNDLEWTSLEDKAANIKLKAGWDNAWVHTFEGSFMWRFE